MMSGTNVSPINVLQELCVKHNVLLPKYDLVQCGVNETKTFAYIVTAFDSSARGEATAKQQAKHLSAVALLENLRETGRLVIESIPEIPRPAASLNSVDPVSCLLELCAKELWPMPQFKVIEQTGESHAPVFTMICQLSGETTTGRSNSKKAAKKIVARQMLDIMERKLAVADPPIPILEMESVEEVIKRYRRVKKDRKKPMTDRLSDRHYFFEKLPKDQQEEAAMILCSTDLSIEKTSREIVHLTCAALKLQYKVSRLRDRNRNLFCKDLSIFELETDFDCVICGKLPGLWNEVISYFKNMLNLTEY